MKNLEIIYTKADAHIYLAWSGNPVVLIVNNFLSEYIS